jgi:outer membrane protein OmpA-like peptidoglycan-associated protein
MLSKASAGRRCPLVPVVPSRVALVALIASLGAVPSDGQAQERGAASPDNARSFARVTLDLLAAGRKLPGEVLGDHVWGGGAMVAVQYRPFSFVGLSVGALGTSAPQLNFRNQSVLNEFSPTVALVWHAVPIGTWQPYAVTGVAHQRFKVEEPPANVAARTRYAATHLAAGLMHDLTRFTAWKTELTAQLASGRTSYGMNTGLSVRLSGAKPFVAPRRDTVVVHETKIVRDTVVMTRERRVTDTLIVRDTVVVDRPRDVPRVVRGEDIILTLKDANFDFARANLRPEAFNTLNDLATQLTGRDRPIRILVVGHTDDIGSDDANRSLGRARAESVRRYLAERGVAVDRIETDSGGESQPIATNKTAAGRQLNRRVVISRIP